ncbi:MAG TPA: hypothetical protein VG275_12375 [Solirubrobacteraceae bacterium]|nr:hypothetical protein [Solirubrobacteraceae bacterium]
MNGAASAARAADSRLADVRKGAPLAERTLERAELAVGSRRSLELRPDQVGAVTAEAMELEHEPADVAELELTEPPQEASAPTDPAALEEAPRLLGGGSLGLRRRLCLGRRLWLARLWLGRLGLGRLGLGRLWLGRLWLGGVWVGWLSVGRRRAIRRAEPAAG